MKETNIFVPWFIRKVPEEEKERILKGTARPASPSENLIKIEP